jgi:hypothetical protein
MILAAVFLATFVQQASAASNPIPPGQLKKGPVLLGTTGACNNAVQGGPCTQNSTLVQLDPATGALIQTIGPVGFTVNGLAWDRTSGTLYASTAIGCGLPGSVCPFHGLITIDPKKGTGKPVDPNVHNFGLAGDNSPIHSINIDPFGNMVGWYDEFPPPDTYVRINQHTGVATEFTNTGINTNQNGVAFGLFNLLWNIDSPKCNGANCGPGGADLTQTAYILNPFTGKKFASVPVTPPTNAALGDFLPGTNRYYGLNFQGFDPLGTTFIELVDLDPVFGTGTVTTLGQTVDFLHTLAFIQ